MRRKNWLQSRYLAGLWEINLIHQLAWRCGYPVSTRPEKYRAPSWSWASIDSNIDYFSEMYSSLETSFPLAEVLEVRVELATDDEMGQVKGGFLILSGQLREAEYRQSAHCKSGQDTFFVDGHEMSMLFYQDEDDSRCVYRLASLFEPYTKLWCLPIGASVGLPSELTCLVLAKKHHDEETFVRVGPIVRYNPLKDTSIGFKNPILPLVENVGGERSTPHTLVKNAELNVTESYHDGDKTSKLTAVKII